MSVGVSTDTSRVAVAFNRLGLVVRKCDVLAALILTLGALGFGRSHLNKLSSPRIAIKVKEMTSLARFCLGSIKRKFCARSDVVYFHVWTFI